MKGEREPCFDAQVDEWREAFEKAWRHVPLSLYDEDLKPSEQAFGEMLAALDSANSQERAT